MLKELFQDLREKVPRLTHARKEVLRCLYEAKEPLTAQDIHQRLESQAIDAATVYRNLETLFTLGFAEKVEHSQSGIRYALSSTRHTHSISCEQCRCRVDIGTCFMSDVEKLIRNRTGFQGIHHVVNFSGVCPQCQAQS